MKKALLVIVMAVVLGLSTLAQAELVNHGNGLIYDTGLNITWYDAPRVNRNWADSVKWATNLAVTDVNGNAITGWRLPTTLGTKQGGNFVDSELAHLYYNELKNKYGYFVNSTPFVNLVPGDPTKTILQYWTGTTLTLNASVGWDFHFQQGFSHSDGKGCRFFALAVHDGKVGAPVVNSSPVVAPTGGGVYQVNTTVVIGGQVFDADGDQLSYEWFEGETFLYGSTIPSSSTSTQSTTAQTASKISPYFLTPYTIDNLGLGVHTFTLVVNDGVNKPVSSNISVEVIDTIAPVLVPAPDKTILWPPNNKMVPVTIITNATDNSGAPVLLKVLVSCNEVQKAKGNSGKDQVWTEPVIADGMINLQLLATRNGNGEGRVYTITIEATDPSQNTSVAKVDIIVPHDNSSK